MNKWLITIIERKKTIKKSINKVIIPRKKEKKIYTNICK